MLVTSFHLEVMLRECVIFSSHHFSLTPLQNTSLIVLGLVPSEQVLQSSDVLETEIIKSEFKVNQRVILVQTVDEHSANILVQLVITKIQA